MNKQFSDPDSMKRSKHSASSSNLIEDSIDQNFKVVVRVRPPLSWEVDGTTEKFVPIVSSVDSSVPDWQRPVNDHHSRVSWRWIFGEWSPAWHTREPKHMQLPHVRLRSCVRSWLESKVSLWKHSKACSAECPSSKPSINDLGLQRYHPSIWPDWYREDIYYGRVQ